MDRAALQARLAGPVAYPPTPFTADDPEAPVDLEAFRRLIRRLVEHGVPAVTPCGGTGECFSLSIDEWQAVTEAAVDEAAGRALVLASVSGSIGRAIAQARAAERLGCPAAQITMVDPMFGMTDEGAERYNRAVAEAAGIGFMLYRTPAVPLSVASARRLAGLGNVVAVKEESGDIQWFRACMAAQRGEAPDRRLAGVCGGEGLFPYYALEGAAAFSTGAVNLAPALSMELWHAVRAGDRQRIGVIQERLAPLAALRAKPGRSIPVVKEGLRLLGVFPSSACRPPLADLMPEECAQVEAMLREWEIP
jgi:4-hydroxy-tetrahydrodipicolinate synthase